MKAKRIHRRTLLRAAGAALPLPLLDIMVPKVKAAEKLESAAVPPRYIWLYQPCGFYPDAWNPSGSGLKAKYSTTMEPLEPFRNCTTIIRNLWNNAKAHAGNTTALLTGRQAITDLDTGRIVSAKSIDQHIAEAIGEETAIRSMEIGIDVPPSGPCASGLVPLSYGATLSWQNESQLRMVEVRPLTIYQSLFGVSGATAKRAALQSSILDLVREEARDIARISSRSDKRKLDSYLEAVRATERSLQRSLNPPKRSWTPPTEPDLSQFPAPAMGVPRHRPTHMKLMLDLLTLALWTDRTRVATFAMGAAQCNANFDFIDGVNRPFHEGCSHHNGKEELIDQYVRINRWHASQVAYFLKRMQQIDEGNGSLLDNSLVFFGSSLKDGSEHSCLDLPIAMFGKLGGRVQPRGQVFLPERTLMADLHFTTMHWYGIAADDFNANEARTLTELG